MDILNALLPFLGVLVGGGVSYLATLAAHKADAAKLATVRRNELEDRSAENRAAEIARAEDQRQARINELEEARLALLEAWIDGISADAALKTDSSQDAIAKARAAAIEVARRGERLAVVIGTREARGAAQQLLVYLNPHLTMRPGDVSRFPWNGRSSANIQSVSHYVDELGGYARGEIERPPAPAPAALPGPPTPPALPA